MKRLAEWGSGTKCRGGAVRRTAGNPRWGSWLASLAPPPRLRRYSPVPLPLHGGEVLDGPAAGAEDFSPTKRLAEWGSGTKCRGGAVRRTAGKSRWVSWLASLAPPPRLRRLSPVPLPLHGGEVLDGPAAGAEDFSPTKRSAEWGSGTKCRGGAVRRTAGKSRWVSWLASLGPPPRLRRCSPVPLPLHGGEVLDGPAAGAEDFSPTKRSAEWGSGTKCRGGAVRRTAGKSRWVSWLASLAPPPRLRRCSPVSLPLHGGEVHGRNLLVCPSCRISPSTSTPWRSGCSGCP